ncbi:MAG: metallophosphoesterase [Lachnospiraceae bacterium]|nr:metallophosphoesterase [Lachnospiraceae bacterium]
MRIIHCADIHLDSKMEANLSKEKARERNNEILITFRNMVEYANLNQIDAIIIAGDLFDTKNVSALTKNMLRDIIVSNNNIEFLYLKGNHDKASFFDDCEYLPDNLKMFNEEWTYYNYGDVCIGGILLNNNDRMIYNELTLNENMFNIVVMHGQTLKYINDDITDTINIPELKNKNIDYLALGHIHSYIEERLDDRGIYCYSGCLEGRGFDECGPKGFVVLDIDNHKLNTTFVKFSKRDLSIIEADITNCTTTMEAEGAIERAIENISKDDLVKIYLTGEVSIDAEIDTDFLNDRFGNIFYYAKIYNKSTLAINYKDYMNDISLKGEFIRMVLNSELSKDEKDQIILHGLKALTGEELV